MCIFSLASKRNAGYFSFCWRLNSLHCLSAHRLKNWEMGSIVLCREFCSGKQKKVRKQDHKKGEARDIIAYLGMEIEWYVTLRPSSMSLCGMWSENGIWDLCWSTLWFISVLWLHLFYDCKQNCSCCQLPEKFPESGSGWVQFLVFYSLLRKVFPWSLPQNLWNSSFWLWSSSCGWRSIFLASRLSPHMSCHLLSWS